VLYVLNLKIIIKSYVLLKYDFSYIAIHDLKNNNQFNIMYFLIKKCDFLIAKIWQICVEIS
jgi:hypothetical protein